MWNITIEELKKLDQYKDVLETMVRNHSSSSMVGEIAALVIELNNRNGFNVCKSCGSDLYLATTRVYTVYLEQRNKIKENGNKSTNRKQAKRNQGL